MLEKLSPAEWYLYTRKELALGVGEFGDDAARIDNISTIFPVFFLAVAALVCLTTMARMVEEQRTEIGTLKALGYTDREIQKKYLIYSLSATVLGSGLGLAVRCRPTSCGPRHPRPDSGCCWKRCRLSGGGFPSAIRSRCAICSGIKSGC